MGVERGSSPPNNGSQTALRDLPTSACVPLPSLSPSRGPAPFNKDVLPCAHLTRSLPKPARTAFQDVYDSHLGNKDGLAGPASVSCPVVRSNSPAQRVHHEALITSVLRFPQGRQVVPHVQLVPWHHDLRHTGIQASTPSQGAFREMLSGKAGEPARASQPPNVPSAHPCCISPSVTYRASVNCRHSFLNHPLPYVGPFPFGDVTGLNMQATSEIPCVCMSPTSAKVFADHGPPCLPSTRKGGSVSVAVPNPNDHGGIGWGGQRPVQPLMHLRDAFQ